jgi:hypothetical protein
MLLCMFFSKQSLSFRPTTAVRRSFFVAESLCFLLPSYQSVLLDGWYSFRLVTYRPT